MFSKVIIATDLSKASNEVIKCAQGLIPLGAKEIILTECLKTLEATSLALAEDIESVDGILEEQKSVLEKQGFKVRTEKVFGTAHVEINRLIKEYNCDAVMVPSLGHSLLHEITLGSLAGDLIHHITKPLLLVRLKVENSKNEKENQCVLASSCEDFHSSILYATDFSEHADKAFLYMEKLVKSGAKKVTLIHIQDMVSLAKASKELLKEYDNIDYKRLDELKERLLKISDTKVNTKVVYGKPANEILKYADEIKPALIVAGTHGRGFIGDLFVGSISHNIVRHANSSVLLIPKEETREDE
ncbi:MAG: universal stress protein [candidate division KSB1 bacterium]|nr:universal stress protein [candidate division KSB1 bacterium]